MRLPIALSFGALAVQVYGSPKPAVCRGETISARQSEGPVDAILARAPVFDGHIDLPWEIRSEYRNNASAVPLNGNLTGHVDIPRLREGRVGGFFWSVYVSCGDATIEGPDFLNATWRVRDTLEQIDISKQLISRYPDDFASVLNSEQLTTAFEEKKIGSLLGVEGGHQFGNSFAVVRQYYDLGVRYATLTHSCHNAFADSIGSGPGKVPLHNGLSPLGYKLVDEMNRLGMLIDLSHTADSTASQALAYSKAPVIWSHSSARAVFDHVRNLPDEILEQIGEPDGDNDAVVLVNFYAGYVAPAGEATVASVADHIDHIAEVAGKKHVGLGSDYDGVPTLPTGLEDVSKYPNLILELYERGWTEDELADLTNGNFVRVLRGAERVAKELQAAGTLPANDIYEKRTDI